MPFRVVVELAVGDMPVRVSLFAGDGEYALHSHLGKRNAALLRLPLHAELVDILLGEGDERLVAGAVLGSHHRARHLEERLLLVGVRVHGVRIEAPAREQLASDPACALCLP